MLDSHFQDAKDICWTGSAATCLMCQIWLSRVTLAFSCVQSACQRDGGKLPRASCAWRKLSFAHRRSCTLSTEKDFVCLQPYPILYNSWLVLQLTEPREQRPPSLTITLSAGEHFWVGVYYPNSGWACSHNNRQTQCKFWCLLLYADLSSWSPVPPRVDGWQD